MADGAIFHLDVSTVSRSTGRSAVAAAAYRAGTNLLDARTGLEHDYRRKGGVVESFIAAPDGCDWITDRNTLWDAAEAAENRKNSTVAREWLVALPDALDALQRAELARALATVLVARFGVAVDVAIHAPNRKGDTRNHHAHLLTTTRTAGPDGLGDKTRVLDAAKTGGVEIAAMRAWWAGTVNDALAAAQSTARVDHRRKSVIAVEARAEAKVLEQQAADVGALNAKPSEVGGIWKGLGHAARALRSSGISALTSTNAQVEKLKARALALREKAEHYSKPLNRHHGPRLTSFFRRMEPVWKREAEAIEARRAAQEATQRRLEAQKADEARKAKEASEAALRAAEKAAQMERARDDYAKVTLPLIERARKDPLFATRITRWGIELDRPDRDVARDDLWRRSGKGYEGRLIWAIVADEAKEADRKAKEVAQHQQAQNLRAFTENMVRRADTFPTPAGQALWPFPVFKALDPDSLQTSFASKYHTRLSVEDVTRVIRQTLECWVNRITQELSILKDGKSPTWLSLTGGHRDAAQSLSRALDEHPDLKRSLFSAIAGLWPPEPEPEQPKPKPTQSSGPTFGM